METRRLYRSKTDRMVGGICGGLGKYLNVDSTVLRLLLTLLIIFTGIFPGVIFYIIALFIIPQEA